MNTCILVLKRLYLLILRRMILLQKSIYLVRRHFFDKGVSIIHGDSFMFFIPKFNM